MSKIVTKYQKNLRNLSFYLQNLKKWISLVFGQILAEKYAEPEGHLTPPEQLVEENGQFCDPFIYPILDCGNHPWIAVGVLFGGCIALPLLHLFWLGISRLREWIFFKLYHKTSLLQDIQLVQDHV